MRIALIAPPFIPVPPKVYGGTELFLAQLALGLKQQGIDAVVYGNGESTVQVEKRWIYERSQWPLQGDIYDNLKDLSHATWAAHDAAASCDIVHLNNAPGLVASRFVDLPFVYTLHHPHVPGLSQFYREFPDVQYVTISGFQMQRETMPRIRTIHHGIDLARYRFCERKQPYLSFIGRIAPMKGTHLAIQVAKLSGIPLKIAGEVQPIFRDYFESQIAPHLDGRFVEYIGEADLAAKNELLGNSQALLFPIQWDEPFGLVMLEAMACGTPVLALPGGSVREVVREGVSGHVCADVPEMAQRAQQVELPPALVREYVEDNFSLARMVADYAALYRQLLDESVEPEADLGAPAVA